MDFFCGERRLETYLNTNKNVRIITCSECRVHSEPIFKMLEFLMLQDLCIMKIMKFYNNLSDGLLPSCLDSYIEVINKESLSYDNNRCFYVSSYDKTLGSPKFQNS